MLNHLAIIMDGNGRWAKSRVLPRAVGHKKGASAAKDTIKLCIKHEVKYLTLYTFSAENWQRPKQEVNDLMNLFRFYLDHELKEMHQNGLRLRFIGNRQQLSQDIIDKIEYAEQLTINNNVLNLNIALSYGSRQELVSAVKNIAVKMLNKQITPEEICEKTIDNHLYTHDIPDPDMLIRTGGEHRISNYLLWQCAYTELYFTDILWPDFNELEFTKAIEEFSSRERRFGKTKADEVIADE